MEVRALQTLLKNAKVEFVVRTADEVILVQHRGGATGRLSHELRTAYDANSRYFPLENQDYDMAIIKDPHPELVGLLEKAATVFEYKPLDKSQESNLDQFIAGLIDCTQERGR